MEPVRGRRVLPLRASLAESFGTPTVQGEPFHIIRGEAINTGQYTVPLGVLTTAVEGTVVGVAQAVQQVAQAERQAEANLFNFLRRELTIMNGNPDDIYRLALREQGYDGRRGPYQGG